MDTTCATCGNPIAIRPRDYKVAGNYCSKACWYASGASRPARKTGMMKECSQCGKSFYAIAARGDAAQFCSRGCKGTASRLAEKPCAVCGKMFKPVMGRSAQPCCSRECGYVYRQRGETRACALCGVAIYVPPEQLKYTRNFCSRAHAHEWQGRNKTEHTCKTCGKAFRCSPSRHKVNNITYCSLACRDADPERREMLIAMNAMQQRRQPNNVERAGYALLDALGVAYEPQYVIGGKFCVDAFVPSLGVVIQWDGDYWHGNPTHFPEPDARQLRRMRLDRSQDAYMTACGYRVVRVWASELERQPEQVAARLCALLTPLAHTPAAQE